MSLTLFVGFALHFDLVVQISLSLTFSWQTHNSSLDGALLDDTRVVLRNRMLLNKLLLLLGQVLCNLLSLLLFFNFNSPLGFEILHDFLGLIFLILHLFSNFGFIARFAQVGELAHCLVKHGQKLIRLQI